MLVPTSPVYLPESRNFLLWPARLARKSQIDFKFPIADSSHVSFETSLSINLCDLVVGGGCVGGEDAGGAEVARAV